VYAGCPRAEIPVPVPQLAAHVPIQRAGGATASGEAVGMSSQDSYSLHQMAEKLYEFSELEGSEFGEYLSSLSDLARRSESMSNEFMAAVKTEMARMLDWIAENCEVVEEDQPSITRKTKVLRFLNE
jgi:hypothetical protein